MPASCAARATLTSGTAAPARTRMPSTAISLKPRPSRTTTPGTPPSRTIRLEPRPIDGHRDVGWQMGKQIGEIGFVLRHEQNLRRTADAKPGQLGKRLVGQQAGRAAAGIFERRRADDVGKAHTAAPDRLIEPSREHFLSEFARRRAERARLHTQFARIEAGFAELDGVADQPAFEPRRLRFQMKLQGELRRRAHECLHRAMLRRSELRAAGRQFAIVAVPMQHRRRGERRQHRLFDRRPSASTAPSRSP